MCSQSEQTAGTCVDVVRRVDGNYVTQAGKNAYGWEDTPCTTTANTLAFMCEFHGVCACAAHACYVALIPCGFRSALLHIVLFCGVG
jgi:hypothetical protein